MMLGVAYRPSMKWTNWIEWGRRGSNPRPRDYESPALTTELRPQSGLSVAYSEPCPAYSSGRSLVSALRKWSQIITSYEIQCCHRHVGHEDQYRWSRMRSVGTRISRSHNKVLGSRRFECDICRVFSLRNDRKMSAARPSEPLTM